MTFSTDAGAANQPAHALTLGWVVGELFEGTFPKESPARETASTEQPGEAKDRGNAEHGEQKPTVELSGLGDLPAAVLFETRLAWGAGLADKTGLEAVKTTWAISAPGVAKAGSKELGQPAVKALHEALLAAFLSDSLELAHTYDLGRSLRGTVTPPTTVHEVNATFREGRINKICERLEDMADNLPPHAAAAVAGSLRNWEKAASDPNRLIEAAQKNATRQGTLWLSVLIGEKSAISALDGKAYVSAARRVIGQLWSNVGDLLRVFGIPMTLLVGALGLLLWTVIGSGSWQSVIGALGAVAAAFGITRQSAKAQETSFLRSIVAAMWTEEVDAAGAQAITLLPT